MSSGATSKFLAEYFKILRRRIEKPEIFWKTTPKLRSNVQKGTMDSVFKVLREPLKKGKNKYFNNFYSLLPVSVNPVAYSEPAPTFVALHPAAQKDLSTLLQTIRSKSANQAPVGYIVTNPAVHPSFSYKTALSLCSLVNQWKDVEDKVNIKRDMPELNGFMTIQDLSSQRFVNTMLFPCVAQQALGKKAICVLDACAGSGGKTWTLLAHLCKFAEDNPDEKFYIQLHLTDIREKSLNAAYWRIKEFTDAFDQEHFGSAIDGMKINLHEVNDREFPSVDTQRIQNDTSTIDVFLYTVQPQEEFHSRADVILLDTPCSGMGTLRRAPHLLWHAFFPWKRGDKAQSQAVSPDADEEEVIQSFADEYLADNTFVIPPYIRSSVEREAALLHRAADHKRAAYVLYSTCSILDEENSLQIRNVLSNSHLAKKWELLTERLWQPEVEKVQGAGFETVYGGDGFYGAILRRKK